jgi:hypoxanthine-DNA glycosylase
LFILGSLPGDASLAAERYYAHPSNQFWRLLGGAIDEELQAIGYDQRLDRLASRKIGLWDVIGSAMRDGSLDQAIRDAQHNSLEALLESHPEVRAIAFNGSTAARIGAKLLADTSARLQLLALPSSSAANTTPFAQKQQVWSALSDWAGAKSLRQA